MKGGFLTRKTPLKPVGFKPKAEPKAAKPRQKRCQACKTPFTPFRALEAWCSPECGLIVAQERLAKQERKVDRARKQSLKTKRDYLKEAQVAFNSYIRSRDSNQPCISCGTPLQAEALGGGYDCGHYRSVGSANHLRFNEDNAHGQCKKCNRYDSGRAVDYRIGLVSRIGVSRVECLEQNNDLVKWTKEALISIRDKYRALVRQAKKEAT
jgi:hypothetical protein